MKTKPVIQVENLTKKFTIGKQTRDIREALKNIFSKNIQKPQEITALNKISFNVNEGEVFGIIGPNGSGKSTLLKILSKITYPTSGRAILKGRVSSLLEVGTGFHHELTGRENIFLNGSILGMSKSEIKSKFDEIVDFSGVEKFIDTPVKHYSSGMYVRLAFSVAAHLEPEILLVDEVLSVGDHSFRKKSMGKMNEVANNGRTVILVSHNLGVIKNICQNGIYLDNGIIKGIGKISEVINSYQNSFVSVEKTLDIRNEFIKINSINILNASNENIKVISSGDKIKIKINFSKLKELNNVLVKLIFRDINKQALFSCNNVLTNDIFKEIPKHGEFVCTIPKFGLNIGYYTVDLYLEQNGAEFYKAIEILKFEVFSGDFYPTLKMPYQDRIFLTEQEWSINKG